LNRLGGLEYYAKYDSVLPSGYDYTLDSIDFNALGIREEGRFYRRFRKGNTKRRFGKWKYYSSRGELNEIRDYDSGEYIKSSPSTSKNEGQFQALIPKADSVIQWMFGSEFSDKYIQFIPEWSFILFDESFSRIFPNGSCSWFESCQSDKAVQYFSFKYCLQVSPELQFVVANLIFTADGEFFGDVQDVQNMLYENGYMSYRQIVHSIKSQGFDPDQCDIRWNFSEYNNDLIQNKLTLFVEERKTGLRKALFINPATAETKLKNEYPAVDKFVTKIDKMLQGRDVTKEWRFPYHHEKMSEGYDVKATLYRMKSGDKLKIMNSDPCRKIEVELYFQDSVLVYARERKKVRPIEDHHCIKNSDYRHTLYYRETYINHFDLFEMYWKEKIHPFNLNYLITYYEFGDRREEMVNIHGDDSDPWHEAYRDLVYFYERIDVYHKLLRPTK
jgi:hypothetical protein